MRARLMHTESHAEPHFKALRTPSSVQLQCSAMLWTPRCIDWMQSQYRLTWDEALRPLGLDANAVRFPFLSCSAQTLYSPGMCAATTDHLCLWAHSLFTPASDAVMSVWECTHTHTLRLAWPSAIQAMRMSEFHQRLEARCIPLDFFAEKRPLCLDHGKVPSFCKPSHRILRREPSSDVHVAALSTSVGCFSANEQGLTASPAGSTAIAIPR